MMRIVLVGNQNCGKTTLFNALTGLNQHTGNWPGVTVARKAGMMRGCVNVELIDLPGTYSLHPYTEEEKVTREVLLGGEYDCILNIADAACLARSLYLTRQLTALGRPVVLALNMMDELRRQGTTIDTAGLSRMLHVPVMPIAARSGQGLAALGQALLNHAGSAQKPIPPMPALTEERIADSYREIDRILRETVRTGTQSRDFTQQCDRLLLQTPLGLPVLALVLAGVFLLAFGPLSMTLKEALDALIRRAMLGAEMLMSAAGVSAWLQSLVTDGLLAGVGSVLSFLPTILLLLTGLSLLEDSGLMARAVYLLDRPLRRFGLSGRSFIPLLLGFGCTVPAAMAVRSLPGRGERTLTTLLLPFMSCGAKLPVYALFVQAFFPHNGWLVMAALYLGGILLALALARIATCTAHRGAVAPLMMELPLYRLPTARSVLRGMTTRAGEFLRRTFSVILLATVAVWFLQHVTQGFAWTNQVEESLLMRLSGGIAPVLRPLGFGSAQAAAALLTGILAKESIISTMAVLSGHAGLAGLFPDGACALSFLVFVLLYTPCTAALSAMGETFARKRHVLYLAIWQVTVAWLVAWCVYTIGAYV